MVDVADEVAQEVEVANIEGGRVGKHRAPVPVNDPDLVVAFDGVGVRRGQHWLIRDIDWRVELDERWVVLGPNGAGKTTLLQVAAALMHPTSGHAWVLGQRLGGVDVFELRPRIGMTSAALNGRVPNEEKVIDVVVTAAYAVIGRFREEYDPADLERAGRLLDRFGIAPLAERTYGTLSEGERKRAQIARALMTDPELILLDEPAAGLDLGAREDLVSLLAELAEDPDAPATVLVTHHVEEIPPGFTHAMLLRSGALVTAGHLPKVLTARNLSDTFGQKLKLTRSGERFFARAAD
jgi:iron complex transport system ATP-binding protein